MKNADFWIEHLGMQAHPEGGYYKEVYRSEEMIKLAGLPLRYGSDRSISTSIYFLLTAGNPSKYHRLKSDETWHFYEGDAVKIHMVAEDGQYSSVSLGRNVSEGEEYQFTIPRNSWFAAEVVGSTFTLVGCTVAPGFDYHDFELADYESLSSLCPAQKSLIRMLT